MIGNPLAYFGYPRRRIDRRGVLAVDGVRTLAERVGRVAVPARLGALDAFAERPVRVLQRSVPGTGARGRSADGGRVAVHVLQRGDRVGGADHRAGGLEGDEPLGGGVQRGMLEHAVGSPGQRTAIWSAADSSSAW